MQANINQDDPVTDTEISYTPAFKSNERKFVDFRSPLQ